MNDNENAGFGLVPSKFRIVIEMSDNTIFTLLGMMAMLSMAIVLYGASRK